MNLVRLEGDGFATGFTQVDGVAVVTDDFDQRSRQHHALVPQDLDAAGFIQRQYPRVGDSDGIRIVGDDEPGLTDTGTLNNLDSRTAQHVIALGGDKAR